MYLYVLYIRTINPILFIRKDSMKVTPALRAAVRGFEKSHEVSAARHIVPYLDKTLANISEGIYLDGVDLGPDEAAILRIVFAQALVSKVDTDNPPCTTLGAVFYRRSGEGEPMNYDAVRQLAHLALRKRGEQGPVIANDFIIDWQVKHFIALDEMLEMDDNWGL